ncbi:helix-turn-helix domain-containing protein [Kitasatospora kifunensis]|uniref:HTH merR-type domain-containing protein n=1 Tax=Kitasatospora kifunensis TaxID=58351 RepID=A0A7W7R1W0_KITKI|nr:MerR family transcriptional regulator [Kitasatospora kifunensis]MBB4923871.1 hypothetical protein [Kitasatospora kifunensis]
MDDDTLRTIGELAHLTGLSVKTIRFWSDAGVVPPTDRTPAGYRRYGPDALARLDLVRTLRELGVDLATIQRVLAREVTVAEVAAAHAEALDVQILPPCPATGRRGPCCGCAGPCCARWPGGGPHPRRWN